MLFVGCKDREFGESETEIPSWLGGSIYEELSNPDSTHLTGTFQNYVRLIDDLGYSETLNRTGSKTIFPANDEAFKRFYADNDWGVTCYEDLTEAMKKQLLYTSMLDNAYLVKMLSYVSAGSTEVEKGVAVKHQTQASVIDTITYIKHDQMPQNNPYWDAHNSLYYVSDNTRPMMVHFTREHMLNNSITTTGEGSDFEIITGEPYEDGAAYIYRNKIIKKDVTCQNGYIHQMQDVIVPPGNMANVIRKESETSLFSRILDRFCAPYYDATTTQAYNDWAIQYERPLIDSIYQMRYFSYRSQAAALRTTPSRSSVSSDLLLLFDPGWNQYYPVTTIGSVDRTLSDLGVMFVPENDAMEKFFLPGGTGAFMIEQFGKKPNELKYLKENIDSIPQYIMATFINNLMKSSFVGSVPSKFSTIANTAAENMGMKLSMIKYDEQTKQYDIKIANNGVVYVMNEVIMPDEYQAVSAPTLFNDELSVMKWAIQDKTVYKGDGSSTASVLGLDFWAYLIAMSANYGLFVPDNKAFDSYCLDPVSLLPDMTPTGLHFYTISTSPFIACKRVECNYDRQTKTYSFGQEIDKAVDVSSVSTQFADILNTHTVVLTTGDSIGSNHYYKTKQGAAIYVDKGIEGGTVSSGAQMYEGLPVSTITKKWNEKNGRTYRIDHIIQTPTQSVYSILKDNAQFEEFVDLCEGFDGAAETGILEWLGYSKEVIAPATKSAQDQLKIFAKVMQKFTSGSTKQVSIDYNITCFNSHHYTVYAPDNKAMEIAYSKGLPKWTEIQTLFEQTAGTGGSTEMAAITKCQKMVEAMHKFVLYHLQRSYVFADNKVDGGEFQTMQVADNKQFMKLNISGGNGKFNVVDAAGVTHVIDANSGMMINRLAREYQFAYESESSSRPYISTSSYAVIHEIDEPFYYNTEKKFD